MTIVEAGYDLLKESSSLVFIKLAMLDNVFEQLPAFYERKSDNGTKSKLRSLSRVKLHTTYAGYIKMRPLWSTWDIFENHEYIGGGGYFLIQFDNMRVTKQFQILNFSSDFDQRILVFVFDDLSIQYLHCHLHKYKAGYTATPVACSWAAAIVEVTIPFRPEQWGHRTN